MTAIYDDRQTGRTTRQMQEAAQGTYFVWPNEALSYPINLARHLGRTDLKIISRAAFKRAAMEGKIKNVILDHAYHWASQS